MRRPSTFAVQRPKSEIEREVAYPVHCRVAGVAEFESGDVTGARAGVPVELADGETIDVDGERQAQVGRRRRRRRRRLDRDVDVARAEAANRQALADHSAPGFQSTTTSSAMTRCVGAAPRDAPEAHRAGDRTARRLDGDATAAVARRSARR